MPQEWAAVHRKHHHFSDKVGDPHSPKVFGVWKVLFGNYWYYKIEAAKEATLRKYTPDYKPDWIDKIPGIRYGVLVGMGIFCLMFGWAWGLAAWAFHVVAYVLLNSAINSLGHTFGYKNFDNGATNMQWLAFLTGGEGLHNNHHEHPTSARFALRGWEIDPAWAVIWLLQKFGLAHVRPEPLAKAA
jgi:stearoyl-CoA desaturase (delta-9 desaturase)